jgi:hypothetical protein
VQNGDGSWRIRINYKLSELVKNAEIVKFIKSRMAWLGHVMRMDEKRTLMRILQWKPIGRRLRGRPQKRWIEDIEDDIQIMGIRGWRKLCKEIIIIYSHSVDPCLVTICHGCGNCGKESLRRLKPTVGCNTSRRRRRN